MSDEPKDTIRHDRRRPRPVEGPSPARSGEWDRARSITRASRFQALGRLGSGGMGLVDEVRDLLLDRAVARKTLLPEFCDRPEALDDFMREIRLTARLQHPGIVAVHDARLDGPTGPALFMPRLEGRPLTRLIADAHATAAEGLGPDALADLLDIVVRVCDAVAYAHDEGVLHRDLKPDNVMVGDYGEVFVMDWGIALERRPGDDSPLSGGESGVAGTPAYMAPETVEGSEHQLDARTDVYSLGAILHEIVTGDAPRDDMPPERVSCLLQDVRLGRSRAQELEAGPGRPPELVRIVRRATAPRPSERHASASELRADLRRFLRGGGALPRIELPAERVVVHEGEVGDAAYILVEGACEVRQQRGDRVVVRRRLEAGEVFGETALLSPGPRTASVVTVEDSVLVRVTAETLEREVSALKPWIASLIRGLATRAREAESS